MSSGCQPVINVVQYSSVINYEDTFQIIKKQFVFIKSFIQVEVLGENVKKKRFTSEGIVCKDPSAVGYLYDGAADVAILMYWV